MHAARNKLAIGLLCTVLGAGCASQQQIADQMIKANLAIEDVTNRMLVLNVVRAYHQRPMHFTAIGRVSSPLGGGQPGGTLALPFGPDFKTQIYTLTQSWKADIPVFDVSPIDTQDFMRGITNPVPPSVVKYYLEQGWPLAFTLSLFVRKIDVYEMDKSTNVRTTKLSFLNYPPSNKAFENFQDALDDLVKCGMEIESTPSYIGVPATETTLPIASLITAAKEKIKIDSVPYGVDKKIAWRVQQAEPALNLVFRDKDTDACQTSVWKDVVNASTQSSRILHKDGDAKLQTMIQFTVKKDGEDRSPETQVEKSYVIETSLRSPEAMLYYLGEVARVQPYGSAKGSVKNADPDIYVPKVTYGEPTTKAKRVELFVLNRGASADEASATVVEYDGERYSIPKENGGQSMHALSLVAQLIGLQKKASDLPSSTTFRLLGN